jgi:hypothetical protein
MANISVAELLYDPDFVDPVTVLRQMQTVGDDGMAYHIVQPISIVASVQSISEDLAMTPDLARTEGTYEIITTFALATATDQTAADVVLWQGALYRVTAIGRFGNFRQGFGQYEGIMTLTSIPVPLWLARWDAGGPVWDDISSVIRPHWDDGITAWDTLTEAWDDLKMLWDGTR